MSDGNGGPRGLDMSQDPDRYDPAKDTSLGVPRASGPHADAGGGDHTLPDLLGDGAHEEDRVGLEWLAGLVAVFLFLGLVVLVFTRFATPS